MNKILFFFSMVLFTSCHSKPNDQKEADAPIYSKLTLQTISLQNYSTEFNATASVKPITGQMAQISVPFGGRITKSFVQLGQRVKAGAPLFEMSSSDYYEATKHYYQASQSKQLAERNLQREKDLVAHGVGVQKELDEAQTDFEIAKRELDNAAAVLRTLNVNPETMGTQTQALRVVSPIAGEVVQNSIVLGQLVKSDADPLLSVAELSKVWVVAEVKERHLNDLHLEDKIEIHTDANPAKKIEGKIALIGALLDENTRSVQVIITCDNADGALKPGMFANVRFINIPSPSILIPSTAILQAEGKSYVFVQVGKDHFVRRDVKVTTAQEGTALVTEGLSVGDVIVAQGAIYLMQH